MCALKSSNHLLLYSGYLFGGYAYAYALVPPNAGGPRDKHPLLTQPPQHCRLCEWSTWMAAVSAARMLMCVRTVRAALQAVQD